jgi:uncharacterized Zn finger protein
VLAEAFDRDPFLLFELRGRPKAAVLAALRALRAGGAGPRTAAGGTGSRPGPAGPAAAARAAGTELRDVTPATYDAFRHPVTDLRFHIAPPAVPGVILRQLGPPPGWSLPTGLEEALRPAVARASRRALDLAMEPPGTEADGA